MRGVAWAGWLVVGAAVAARAEPPEQVTASAGDSTLERFGPDRLAAVGSRGDLTPGAPGNGDGSKEIYLLHVDTLALRQVTSSSGDSAAVRVTGGEDVAISSRADLTPGAPGNADASFESWLWDGATSSLVQATASDEDSFFQTFWDEERRAFYVSKGDLPPGMPGNADGSNEVFVYDVEAREMAQLTNSSSESLVRSIVTERRIAIVQSSADLTPAAPGNADGSREIFFVDLDSFALTQVTASSGDTTYAGRSGDGRWLAFESDGDLTPGQPGNADGSQEVVVYDLDTDSLRQVTSSPGDSAFAAFVPRRHRVVAHSREELAPGKPGNGDGSQEVFVADIASRRVVQHTDSTGDSSFAQFATPRSRRAAIVSGGDLTPGQPGNLDASQEVYLKRLDRRRSRTVQVTAAGRDVTFIEFEVNGRWVLMESDADLTGANPDNSREVFVARVRGRPRVMQVTDSVADSVAVGFTFDRRTLLVESRGDLAPGVPGNADGSLEVFKFIYR